jgi:hypothetical protein
MSTTPTVGRTVNFVLPPGAAGGFSVGEIRPLIVTQVWAENQVNGHVVLDGRNDSGHDDHAYTVPYAPVPPEGAPTPGTWHWPARV